MNRRNGAQSKSVEKHHVTCVTSRSEGHGSAQRSRSKSPGMKYSKKLKTQLLREFFQRGFLNPNKSNSVDTACTSTSRRNKSAKNNLDKVTKRTYGSSKLKGKV